MTIICIYHKNCADGFGAALAVKTYADKYGIDAEFTPAHYGDTPPDCTGKTVYIVDFSYPRETLIKMKEKADHLTVIDHHKSAQENLKGLDFCKFDMSKSGAVLTWEFLFPSDPVPELLLYIQDRDLWKFELKNSKEFSAGLQLLGYKFEYWEIYLDDCYLDPLFKSGRTILRYQKQCIDKITQLDKIPMRTIAGYSVPCINTTHLISEIGNELAKGHPFCALYFETADKRVYSLRSAKDGIDVSEIAKKFGGGGHYHAAGFSLENPLINLLP